jgi:carboxymethylenebutenolidase
MTDIDCRPSRRPRRLSPRAYLASPAGTGPWPAVVMIHEVFGLDDVMRGHADRLAVLLTSPWPSTCLARVAPHDAWSPR